MRGVIVTLAVLSGSTMMAAPVMAVPRTAETSDNGDCTTPHARSKQVKSMTEPVPVRKKDRERTKRILM